MTLSHWRIFTDTKRPDGAQRLTFQLQAQVDRDFDEVEIEDYRKGGHVVTFVIKHEFDDWQSTVYDVIQCVQRAGHGCSISGFIEEELELTLTGSSISGINLVSCFCHHPGTADAK